MKIMSALTVGSKTISLRPTINSSRYWLDDWMREAGQTLSDPSARVLDAGAGEAPYRSHFAHVQYETADFAAVDKAYGSLDYVCDLSDIPVDSETYDLIICTQVLEHLPEPVKTLREFNRLLKAGGSIRLTAPLFYQEHEQPYDYFRYTQFAWRAMANEAGLAVVAIDWLEGYDGTLSYQLGMAARSCARWNVIGRFLFLSLAVVHGRRDMRRRRTDVGMPKNYRVVLSRAAD